MFRNSSFSKSQERFIYYNKVYIHSNYPLLSAKLRQFQLSIIIKTVILLSIHEFILSQTIHHITS